MWGMIDSLLVYFGKKNEELRIHTGEYGALNADFEPDAVEERKLRPRPDDSISDLQAR